MNKTKYFNAYLMVEFSQKTKLPQRIGVYSESANTITTIGNEYVEIASLELKVCGDEKDIMGFHILVEILETQLKHGKYDDFCFNYKDKKWTIVQCRSMFAIKYLKTQYEIK